MQKKTIIWIKNKTQSLKFIKLVYKIKKKKGQNKEIQL